VDDTSPTRIRLQVLGLFDLHIDDQRVELPLQAQRLLGYLAAVQPAQSRAVLAGCLWGETPQDRAMATLRNALWQLRRAGSGMISTSRDRVIMNPCVSVDLADARRCAAAIAAGAATDLDTALIDLLDADVLTTWEDDWLRIERERMRQMRIHALESLAESWLRRGRYAEAIQAALTAVRAEPLRESAQAALIKAFLSEGNPSEAVRQFESYRQLLATELGLRPSARMQALVGDGMRAARVG
jgi:DNA-binding SARP family transcriptional activator